MENGMDEPHPTGRLACQACQRKKIKCDRTYPCGQCTRSNLACTASTRKQRARHAGKRGVDSELKNRISKLESLVESLSGDIASGPPSNESDQKTTESTITQHPNESGSASSMRKYVASPFWTSLTSEVQALRDALEEDEPEGDTPDSGPAASTPPAAGSELSNIEYDLIVCPPGRIYVMPGGLVEPTEKVASQIFDVYMTNVEPIFRLYHTPTLTAFMRHGTPYLGQPCDTPGNQAVKRAVWMAAINSMSEHECLDITGEHQADAINHYRRLVGISLAQADLVNTTDFATLQAFVTYLTASRTSDHTRRLWTLLSLLVRIATAMGLHREPSANCTYFTPYHRELRRRLWWRIRYLDVFSSIDRGSELLVSAESCSVPIPTLTNDNTFDENSSVIPNLEGQDTDLSFTNSCYDACVTIEPLLKPQARPNGETWEKRHQLALDFAARVDEQYLQYFNKGTAFDNFRKAVVESMKASMVLRAVRPMQQYVSSTPPRVDSPYVLRMAMENLRSSEQIYKTESAERWRWQIWVQWHALAVALAGLCSIRNTPLADETWSYVERQYEQSAKYVADTKSGMLWRPVEKLYKKATAFRDAAPGQTPKFTPAGQERSNSINVAPSQHSFNEPTPVSGTSFNTYPAFNNTFIPNYPSSMLDSSAPSNLSLGSMSLDPPMDATAQDFSNSLGSFDSFAADPSWIDWSQIMNDYADTGDMMTGVQAWPLLNQQNLDGSFL